LNSICNQDAFQVISDLTQKLHTLQLENDNLKTMYGKLDPSDSLEKKLADQAALIVKLQQQVEFYTKVYVLI
jgi:hypothetical protein